MKMIYWAGKDERCMTSPKKDLKNSSMSFLQVHPAIPKTEPPKCNKKREEEAFQVRDPKDSQIEILPSISSKPSFLSLPTKQTPSSSHCPVWKFYIRDLDSFLTSVYEYYLRGGYVSIESQIIVDILAFFVTSLFIFFFMTMVNYNCEDMNFIKSSLYDSNIYLLIFAHYILIVHFILLIWNLHNSIKRLKKFKIIEVLFT